MSKIDHLSDASGILVKKVANAVALVILTFFPVVQDAYSDAHVIYSSLFDRRTTRNSIFNVESEHISIFLSVLWIRNYLKKRWNVSFQRTRKIIDQCTELALDPYSMKFEIAARYRTLFSTEDERISAIKSLSNDLLEEYHKNHAESEILLESDNSICSTNSSEILLESDNLSPILSSGVINQLVTPDSPPRTPLKLKGRKLFTSSKLKLLVKSLRITIQRYKATILDLQNQLSSKKADYEKTDELENRSVK
jgi:hypothetical protein